MARSQVIIGYSTLDEEYINSFFSTVSRFKQKDTLRLQEDYYLLTERSLSSLRENIADSLASAQCVVLFFSENFINSLLWKYLSSRLNKVSADVSTLLVHLTPFPPEYDQISAELYKKFKVIFLSNNPVSSLSPEGREEIWLRVNDSIDESLKLAGNETEASIPDIETGEFLICWDPDVVSSDDYAALITALGDIVRSEGGIGVERIRQIGFGIPVNEGTLV